MYFMGAPVEMQTLEIVAEVASECLKEEMPLMVEALPCPNPAIPDTLDAQMMADACRIAFEHGADIAQDLLHRHARGLPQGGRGGADGARC